MLVLELSLIAPPLAEEQQPVLLAWLPLNVEFVTSTLLPELQVIAPPSCELLPVNEVESMLTSPAPLEPKIAPPLPQQFAGLRLLSKTLFLIVMLQFGSDVGHAGFVVPVAGASS